MKKKLLLILLFVMLLLPISVKANTFSATLYGDDIASVGDKIEFTFEMNTDIQVSTLNATLKYDSNLLELLSITPEESWKSESLITSNSLKFTNNNVTGKSSVVTLRFKVKTASTKNQVIVTMDDLKISTAEQEDGTSIILNHEAISKTVKLKSDDNTLSTIKIDDKKITNFSSTTYNYTIEVESSFESVKISSTLNDETAKYVEDFGNRTVQLEYGENKIELKVISESGKEKIYILTIIRKDDRIVDNDLKSIIINGGKVKLEFDKSVLNYTVKGYKLEDIEIEVETSDKEAKYKITEPKEIIIGENTFTVVVTAVTGDEKTYTIIVMNNDTITDTRLKTLAIKGVSIDFNSDKYEYEIRYNKSFRNGLTIYKSTISGDTDIKILGNENLKAGDTITITIDAIDGSGTNTYKIKLMEDDRINFFFILEIILIVILVILILLELRKRKKKKELLKEIKIEEDLEKTKEIQL